MYFESQVLINGSFLLAVLSLFFTQILGFTTSKATILYSTFNAICYFTPMFGAALADSFVGKFEDY